MTPIKQTLYCFYIGTLEIFARPFRYLLSSNNLRLLKPRRLIVHIYWGDLIGLWNEVSAVIKDDTRHATRDINVEEVEFVFYRNEPYTARAMGMDTTVTCGASTWTKLEAWLGSLVRRWPDWKERVRSQYPTHYLSQPQQTPRSNHMSHFIRYIDILSLS